MVYTGNLISGFSNDGLEKGIPLKIMTMLGMLC